MRKLVLVLVAVLSCSVFYASEPTRVATLSGKIALQNSDGYFVLSDGSHWKVVTFVKRWRSISEWWNNVEVVPQNYECTPSKWFVGAEIQICSKYGNMTIDEKNASNEEALKSCTHLLMNPRNGQVLFAIAMHPTECLSSLFKDARQEGYEEGLSKGRLSSYQNANDIYNSGHAAGYKTGYKEGYQAAIQGTQQPQR